MTERETFKVLVCVNSELLGERDMEKLGAMIVECFEMRWPVEVFFRELKSDLGLSDYQGTDFRAFERLDYNRFATSSLCFRTRSPIVF